MTFKSIYLPHPEGPHHGFGKFLGFTFINGQKHETYYASQTERAWREAEELANEGLWDEAWTRYNDYCDLCSNSSRPDISLMNKIITGLNMTYIEQNISNLSKEERQKKFKEVIKSQQRSVYNDSGSKIDKIAKEYGDIIDVYADLIQLKTTNPVALEQSYISNLVEIGEAWLGYCDSVFGTAAYFTEDSVGQRPYEKVHSIVIALTEKKEYKHVVGMCKRMLESHDIKIQSPRYHGIFEAILTECNCISYSESLSTRMELTKHEVETNQKEWMLKTSLDVL